MSKILIDTSIVIDFLRQKDKSKTMLFYFADNKYALYSSIITHTESYAGKSVWERQDAMEALETLFSNIKILPLTEDISKKAGEISVRYSIDIIDAVIASIALYHKLAFATLNVKDFKNIEGLKLTSSKWVL